MTWERKGKQRPRLCRIVIKSAWLLTAWAEPTPAPPTATSGKYIQITLQVWKVTTKSYLRAHRAHQLGFELALEQVDNERVIPHFVPLPGLFCNNLAVNIIKARMRNYLASSEPSVLPLSTRSNNAGSIHLIWPSIRVYRFCVGFVLDPVQILMESI